MFLKYVSMQFIISAKAKITKRELSKYIFEQYFGKIKLKLKNFHSPPHVAKCEISNFKIKRS